MTLPEIGSLWIGPELTWLEQLCLQSFVDAGHAVTLFTYEHVAGVPDGVRVAPAAEIMPGDKILRHARTGSPAYHADIFRLRLMHETDLIWADADAYCVRPWKIAPDAPFYGWIAGDVAQVNNGVLRLAKGSETLRRMTDFAEDPYPIPPWLSDARRARLTEVKASGQGVHVSELPWGVLGPDLLTHMLRETGEISHAAAPHVIYPVPLPDTHLMLKGDRRDRVAALVGEETLSVHLWGRRCRNAAAKRGGLPQPGSWLAEMLDRHGIDPAPTRRLIRYRPPSKAARRAELPEKIDFSMFSDVDVANLILQRSEVIDSGAAVRAWVAGDDAPLLDLARSQRETILSVALERLRTHVERFVDAVDTDPPSRIADIGCGYGLASLVLYHRYQAEMVLIDIESNEGRHFGFADEGAAYADLSTARAFLEANGVPAGKIITLNPNKVPVEEAGTVDLAISLISCGFHYPAKTYEAFFGRQVAPNGRIVLDIRKGSGGIPYMRRFGSVDTLDKSAKLATILVLKETVEA
ncbi:class I SAM-dependent methyltransferase [Palleronia sp.]|uniref:class I SAM-dependent methyltransferase n=1 Tax=Palleronia sp. TaxID=1940284 RepID=UPI0035C7F9FF